MRLLVANKLLIIATCVVYGRHIVKVLLCDLVCNNLLLVINRIIMEIKDD